MSTDLNKICYLYHICKDGDSIDDGYIGVTTNPQERKRNHFNKLLQNNHINPILQESFNINNKQYEFKILLISTIEYCYSMEKILRPSYYKGLNIVPGGEISPFSVESEIQKDMRIKKIKLTKTIKKEKTGTVYNDGTKDILFHEETGTHPFLKRNRYKNQNIKNFEFTSESAKKIADVRSKNETLPAQLMSKNGTHHWFDSSHSEDVAKRNSEKFKGTVTVTDKFGVNSRISSTIFELQNVGVMSEREYVAVATKEAKRRRANKDAK